MTRDWTFGKKVAAGFVLAFALLLGVGSVSYRSTDALTETSYRVAATHVVIDRVNLVEKLVLDAQTARGYLITGEAEHLGPYRNAIAAMPAAIQDLRTLVADDPVQSQRVNELEEHVRKRLAELAEAVEARVAGDADAAFALVRAQGRATMSEVRGVAEAMERAERARLAQRAAEVEAASSASRTAIIAGTLLGLVVLTIAGATIVRSLSSQVGSAVQRVRSSSAELQSAATQQATGAKNSATAMSEITTTISELLASSRQIAESAQRVARVANQTTGSARAGGETVTRTQESIVAIRRQVDQIVEHMLDLGRKSQEIGSVLEIVSELAEQTNILAINATIEAAGAGESGKRFAVVADEIRRLADRVADSTKEIRGLIDDVRGAVNTTVMATETGSKAADAGSRQFVDVTASFREIVELIATTTEAAKEIELSTKQQATAVEQVNIAVSNAAQAARESEASSTQTAQTASQLAGVSRELQLLVQSARSA